MSYGHEPGWYPDPWRQAGYRWWTGRTWTSDVTARSEEDSPLVRQASARAAAAAQVYGAAGTGPAYTPIGRMAGPRAEPNPKARTAEIAVVVGAALVALGSLMPWAEVRGTYFTVTVAGTDGDGTLTLLAGMATAALGVVSRNPVWTTRMMVAALVVSFLVAFVALVDMADVNGRVDASVGIGLWMVLFGAVTSIAGCVHALTAAARRPGA